MRKITDLKELHKNKKGLVVGCGVSAPLVNSMDMSNIVSIGINDAVKIFNPNYILIVDHPCRFSDERKHMVLNAKVDGFMTHLQDLWKPKVEKIVYTLGTRRLEHIDANLFPDVIDFSNNSPFMAMVILYKMGIKRIGMIGVDFTLNHFYAEDGEHNLIKSDKWDMIVNDYNLLASKMKQFGVEIYNLSEVSKLTMFPKIKPEEF